MSYEDHRGVFPFLRGRLDSLLALAKQKPDRWFAGHPTSRADVTAALASVLDERRITAHLLGQRAARLGPRVLTRLVRAYAPVGLIDGCALQFVATPTTAHHVPNLRLHALFVQEMGAREGHATYPASHGEPASHAALYRTMLRECGLYLPDVHTSLFSEDAAIPDESFALALLPLGLSMFPHSRLPEITGVALYYYLVGGSYPLAALAAADGASGRPFLVAHPIPDRLSSRAGPSCATPATWAPRCSSPRRCILGCFCQRCSGSISRSRSARWAGGW